MINVVNELGVRIIDVNAEIGGENGFNLSLFNAAVSDLPAEQVLRLKMKTNGGDVFEAFAIFDALRQLENRTEVDIIGASASAGTIIAAGADYRRISKNSRYLVHFAQTAVRGNKDAVKQTYEQLESFDKQLIDIYMTQITKSEQELLALMASEKWLTAEQALEWGFVNEIMETVINQNTNKMAKFTNLTEEEKEEMDALKAELESVKAELDEMKAAKAAMEEEEIENEVTAAIESGKFKAETKDVLLTFAKSNREGFKAMIEGIEVQKVVVNEPITAKIKPDNKAADFIATKEQFDAAWKAGKFENNTALFQKEYSRFYTN
jgi:ATP-dependent Clp protease, protease subunit